MSKIALTVIEKNGITVDSETQNFHPAFIGRLKVEGADDTAFEVPNPASFQRVDRYVVSEAIAAVQTALNGVVLTNTEQIDLTVLEEDGREVDSETVSFNPNLIPVIAPHASGAQFDYYTPGFARVVRYVVDETPAAIATLAL